MTESEEQVGVGKGEEEATVGGGGGGLGSSGTAAAAKRNMTKLKVAFNSMIADQDEQLKISAKILTEDMKTFSQFAKNKVYIHMKVCIRYLQDFPSHFRCSHFANDLRLIISMLLCVDCVYTLERTFRFIRLRIFRSVVGKSNSYPRRQVSSTA